MARKVWAAVFHVPPDGFILFLLLLSYVAAAITLLIYRKVWWKIIACLSPIVLLIAIALLERPRFKLQKPEDQNAPTQSRGRNVRLFQSIQYFCTLCGIIDIILLSCSVYHMSLILSESLPFGCANNEYAFFDLESVRTIRCTVYIFHTVIFIALMCISLILSVILVVFDVTDNRDSFYDSDPVIDTPERFLTFPVPPHSEWPPPLYV